MAEDKLQKYQTLISELKLVLGAPNFDKIFKKKTIDLSKPDQFLVKMEMSRLSQPCARFIDLRGQVSGEVQIYSHEGKQHFMDNLAISVFEKEVQRHGKYTLAVYEAVMQTENNFKVIQKKALEREKNAEEQPEEEVSTKLIRFASYECRSEERMNYSIKVAVQLGQEQKADATTSDISLSGAKIRLSTAYKPEIGALIGIRLVGLEQDFELGLKGGVQYEVVAIEPISNEYNYIRLKRTFVENNSSFDDFLDSFIHGNKRRYKINLDNTMDAVVCKGYEQYYLPRVSALYVFLSQKGQHLLPSLIMTNENNQSVHYYFEDERKVSYLYRFFNNSRLAHIFDETTPVKETALYTFTHIQNNVIYYYSAFDFELEKNPSLKNLFLSFGSQKDSFKCFKVQIMPSHSEDAFIPLSLPDTAGKNIAKLNKKPSPRVEGLIKDVRYLLLLSDVTCEQQINYFQSLEYNEQQKTQIKKFGHGKSEKPPHTEVVALEYINLRSHARYLYKTPLNLKLQQEVLATGSTIDFSIMGLQIELTNAVELEKGDIVVIELINLQKITKQYDLSELKYEVMAISKSKATLNLKVAQITDTTHPAILFFTQLIDTNKSKLRPCEEAPKIPGLSKALRNMATKSVCQMPIYLFKESSHYEVGAIGLGLYPNILHKLFVTYKDANESINIDPLFPKRFIEQELTDELKKRTRQDTPLKYNLFIRIHPNKTLIEKAIKTQCLKVGLSLEPLSLFLKKAVQDEILFIFQLHVSKTGKPDIDYLANELRYVSNYALHKAKELEEALWAVSAVCDLIDVSNEYIKILGLEEQQLKAMQVRKEQWLNNFI